MQVQLVPVVLSVKEDQNEVFAIDHLQIVASHQQKVHQELLLTVKTAIVRELYTEAH